MPKVTMDFACKKCLAIQNRDESRSNENWSTFDANEKCECWGKYGMRINWEFLK